MRLRFLPPRRISRSSLVAAGAMCLVAAPAAAAVVPGTIVLQTGDAPTGGPTVTDVEWPFVNPAGEVGFVATLSDGDHLVWVGAAPTFLASGEGMVTLDAPESTMGSNGMGAFVYQPDVDGVDGMYGSSGVLAVAGAPAIGTPMPATWIFHTASRMLADGSIYFVSAYDNDPGDGVPDGTVVYYTPDGTAAGLVAVLQSGDVYNDGMADFTLGAFGADFAHAYSDDGAHSIRVLDTTGSTLNDGFVAIDESIVGTPREGNPTGDGDNWDNFDLVAINVAGDYLFTGDTDGPTATDEFIAYDGTIVVREGDAIDGVTLGSGSALRFVALSNLGQAAYAWAYPGGMGIQETAFFACNAADIPNTSQAIFTTIDDELDIDGDGVGDYPIVNITAATPQPTKALGDNQNVYVEVDLDDGGMTRNAIVEFPVSCCGNGMVDPGEECDDGNPDDTDACLSTCVNATCGDGFVQAGVEECDDGNDVDTDECTTMCLAAVCGDGIVQDGVEECDDGNDVDTDDCPTTCVAATCGDGFVLDGVEECDDGNDVDDDECANDCTMNAAGSTGGSTGGDGTGGSTGGSASASGGVDETGGGSVSATSGGDGSGSSGGSGDSTGGVDDGGGCSCRADHPRQHAGWALFGGLMLLGWRRRRDA